MFRCHLCEIKFKDIDLFIRHFSLFHIFEPCNRYTCMQNECYRIFQNLNVFKNHLITNHSEDQEKFLKKECKNSFW